MESSRVLPWGPHLSFPLLGCRGAELSKRFPPRKTHFHVACREGPESLGSEPRFSSSENQTAATAACHSGGNMATREKLIHYRRKGR